MLALLVQYGGKNAASIGAPVGKSIMDALSKSPELSSLDYNRMTFTDSEDKLETTIENGATSVSQSLLQRAEQAATNGVTKRMRYMVQAIMDKDRNT